MREGPLPGRLLILLAGILCLPALAQSYADRNLSLPQGGAESRRPIIIVAPVTPAPPTPAAPGAPKRGPSGAYASDEPGPDIRVGKVDYLTQFKVVGRIPPGSTINKVSWRYTVARKPAGFEARLCWQDAGLCWDVSQASSGSTDFFNGRDASRPFQLYYGIRGALRSGEPPVKGEINQVIVTFDIPG